MSSLDHRLLLFCDLERKRERERERETKRENFKKRGRERGREGERGERERERGGERGRKSEREREWEREGAREMKTEGERVGREEDEDRGDERRVVERGGRGRINSIYGFISFKAKQLYIIIWCSMLHAGEAASVLSGSASWKRCCLLLHVDRHFALVCSACSCCYFCLCPSCPCCQAALVALHAPATYNSCCLCYPWMLFLVFVPAAASWSLHAAACNAADAALTVDATVGIVLEVALTTSQPPHSYKNRILKQLLYFQNHPD